MVCNSSLYTRSHFLIVQLRKMPGPAVYSQLRKLKAHLLQRDARIFELWVTGDPRRCLAEHAIGDVDACQSLHAACSKGVVLHVMSTTQQWTGSRRLCSEWCTSSSAKLLLGENAVMPHMMSTTQHRQASGSHGAAMDKLQCSSAAWE
eukprot:47202-Pelagomonas_calceolata.AAC.5